MNHEIIRIVDIDGIQLDVELIAILDNNDMNYIVYTKGEKQKSGNYIMYVSRLKKQDDVYYLENILNDNEWDSLKEKMSEIINK